MKLLTSSNIGAQFVAAMALCVPMASADVIVSVDSSPDNTAMPDDSSVIARYAAPSNSTWVRSVRANRANTVVFSLGISGSYNLDQLFVQTSASGVVTTHTMTLKDVGAFDGYNLTTPAAPPAGTVLATASFTPGVALGATVGYVVYTFTGDLITLSSDRVYALTINNSNGSGNGAFNWLANNPNNPASNPGAVYAGGFYWDSSNPLDGAFLDAGFAVAGSPVPEPSVLVSLLAVGSVLSLGTRRPIRRR